MKQQTMRVTPVVTDTMITVRLMAMAMRMSTYNNSTFLNHSTFIPAYLHNAVYMPERAALLVTAHSVV